MSAKEKAPDERNRSILLALGGLLAIVLAWLLWSWRNEGPAVVAGTAPGKAVDSDTSRTPDTVHLQDADRWRSHLRDGGVVRLRADGAPLGQEVEVVGLGRLEGEELAFARSSIQRVVDKRVKELIKQYDGSNSTKLVVEEVAFREAEAQARAHVYDAFRRGFENNDYFLVRDADAAPPLPEGYLALNVGVTHGGVPALCVIVIKKTDYAIDGVESFVRDKRTIYLRRVAQDFNGKPDEERQVMLLRYDERLDCDKQWRSVVFPSGLRIDRARALLLVE
jgi:hypothetical protein